MILTPQQKIMILREMENNLALSFTMAVTFFEKKLAEITADKQKNFEQVMVEMKDEIKRLKLDDGIDGEDGIDGQDYILTEHDKKDIANSIDVPIVDRVIERTEVIHEQPIIKNEIIKEIVKENIDTPEQIAKKLNTLDEKVDWTVIKGLKKIIENLNKAIREKGATKSGGGGMGLPVHQSFSTSSSTTTITLSNNVAANSNALWIFYNGQFLVKGNHYTISGKIVTLTFTPQDSTNIDVTYIRT